MFIFEMAVLFTAFYGIKVKDNAVPVHAMKAYRGSEVTAPPILNFGSRWGEWSASSPGRCIPGKELLYL